MSTCSSPKMGDPDREQTQSQGDSGQPGGDSKPE